MAVSRYTGLAGGPSLSSRKSFDAVGPVLATPDSSECW